MNLPDGKAPVHLGKHNCLHQDVGVRQRHHDLRVVPGAVTVTGRVLRDLELTSTPWTYCEIPGDEGVRIRRRSDWPECRLWNLEGRPYLDRGLGKMTTRRYPPPPSIMLTTICSESLFLENNPGTPGVFTLQNSTIVDH